MLLCFETAGPQHEALGMDSTELCSWLEECLGCSSWWAGGSAGSAPGAQQEGESGACHAGSADSKYLIDGNLCLHLKYVNPFVKSEGSNFGSWGDCWVKRGSIRPVGGWFIVRLLSGLELKVPGKFLMGTSF